MLERSGTLDEGSRRELLAIARGTLELHLSGQQQLLAIDACSPALLRPGGAFVTLHNNGRLRGCIGTFDASEALVQIVQRMAVAAATKDSRFPPVGGSELEQIKLEISVLSPLRRARADEIVVGVHGIFVTRGPHRGVLLPQVATENGFDRDSFLAHTCLKAGLDPGAWLAPETLIEVFTAEVFGED